MTPFPDPVFADNFVFGYVCYLCNSCAGKLFAAFPRALIAVLLPVVDWSCLLWPFWDFSSRVVCDAEPGVWPQQFPGTIEKLWKRAEWRHRGTFFWRDGEEALTLEIAGNLWRQQTASHTRHESEPCQPSRMTKQDPQLWKLSDKPLETWCKGHFKTIACG